MIRILTDSASDILPAEAEQLGVTVIPLNVTLEDGTVLVGFNQPTLSLKNLYSDKKLTPVADKSWLLSAQVYCTLTVGSYSVNTNAVTLTVNICDYQRVDHVDGKCLQCGEFHTSDPLLVNEDGYFAIVPDESGDPSKVGGHLVGGGTFFLTKDVIHRSLNAGNATKDNKDTILDLQGHTLAKLEMDNFPYGTFTLKSGTLDQCVYSNAEGKLILDGVTFGAACWEATNNSYLDITVRGDTVFQANVSFSVVEGVVHLRGGTFKEGIDTRNNADSMVFQVENALKEAGDKIDANDKAAVEADLNALKDLLSQTANAEEMTDSQVADIKAAQEKMMESAQKLFAKMYEQTQQAGGQAGPDMNMGGGAAGSTDAGNNDDVVDADYKEV